MRTWPDTRIAFGGDYNPEQWPRETWHEDIELMGRAGVSFVTVGVFSWSWLEPEEGVFETGWLDEVMDLLAEADIAVDLATATATPPPWLSTAYPQILPVDRDGHRLWPGSRQTWCPSSPLYREKALRLTRNLARHYHDHPALAMWHVSNEYACHNVPCACDTCAAAFRVWLERRYAGLDALNEAWGTAFWSQRYTDLDQILPPRRTTAITNPSHQLDYARFTSDTLLDFFRAEKAVLAEHSPGVPVTTNFMTLEHFRHLDYHSWAAEQDVVSTDHYVVDSLEHPRAELAFSADLTRGLAGGRPWVLMEHSTSAVNWQPVNRAKTRSAMVRDSLTHVARGADTVGFFQWRQSRAGAEKYHSALVPHAGADSDLFRGVCELGALAERLGEVVGSTVEADVALVFDYQAGWAASGPAMPSTLLDYPMVGHTVHRMLRQRGVTVDVVHPSADLSRYQLLVVPTLYLVADEHAAAIAAAATAGAHVLVTFFSGIVDQNDHVRLGGYPGAFRDLLGVRAEEFLPLRAGEEVSLSEGQGRLWSEHLDAHDADVVLRYAAGPLAARPAATRRATGHGAAWYLSTLPDEATLGGLLDRMLAEAGVTPAAEVPSGVDAVRRSGPTGSWLFLLNHDTDQDHAVEARGHDLVSRSDVGPSVTVPAGGVAVIRER